jgi:FKBP-type peptidyl-prolyl cis-trans isomerase
MAVSVFVLAQIAGCKKEKEKKLTDREADNLPDDDTPEVKKPTAKLKIKDVKRGTGPAAKDGDTVTVHYTGKLQDGTVFDSSLRTNKPYKFTIGESSVIQGWHDGVPGMKKGGKRRLTIPPHLGYGARGTRDGTIPPNATLIFDIELLKIQPKE